MDSEIGEQLKKNYRSEDRYRAVFAGICAATAGWAAVDQMLTSGNSEFVDELGHFALGPAGSIPAEMAFHYSGLDEEYEEAKYVAMVTAGLALGITGQATQYVISGEPEYLNGMKAGFTAGVNALGQVVSDSDTLDY